MSAFKYHRVTAIIGVTAVVGGLAASLAFGGVLTANTVEAASIKGTKPTKNVIVMISDGWSYNGVQATDYYEGTKQVYENFPVSFAMSTYEDEGKLTGDSQIFGYEPLLAWTDFNYVKSNATDSASAATAMASGVKTYNGYIGMDISSDPLTLVTEYAEAAGKATGVVTSVEFSHATPAAYVAHNTNRNRYGDIAYEMIYNSATDVIMGCGAPDYDNDGDLRTTNVYAYIGQTTWMDIADDGFVTGADADGDVVPDTWTVIRDRSAFQALATGDTPSRVLGIPYINTTLQQARGGDGYAAPYEVALIQSVPTLPEMTAAALNVLDNDEDGFFLMVEGGAVDWASHANQTGRMIEEQMDFNAAVEAVIAWVQKNSNWGETLLVITGDHDCGYLSGVGSFAAQTMLPVIDNGVGNLPGVEWNSGDHTNSLIPLFAKGDAAQLLKWTVDGTDPVRGKYVDNTDLGRLVIHAVSPQSAVVAD